MDVETLKSLSRKELQALAKENGVKANLATAQLIEELSAKLIPVVDDTPVVQAVEENAPESVPTKDVVQSVDKEEEKSVELSVGDEIDALIGDSWTLATIKRINKASYRVVTSSGIESTVKFDAVRSVSPVIESPIAVVSDIVEYPEPVSEVLSDVEQVEESMNEEEDDENMLSCIEESLQEYSFHMQENEDIEDDDEIQLDNDVDLMEDMEVEAENVVPTESLCEDVVDTQPTVVVVAPTIATTAIKKTTFVEASNPFSKLTAKTPVKGKTDKVSFNSGTKAPKPLVSSRTSMAVTSVNRAVTPKPVRQTIHGKAIATSAVVPSAKTPSSTRVVTSTSTSAVIVPKMTKAQQMRSEAVAHKLTQQNDESNQGFQFKTLGSTSALAHTNAIKPSIGAATPKAKTPGSAIVNNAKPASAVVGSTKRKLTTAFGSSTVGAGQNISAHLDVIPTATTSTTPAVPPATVRKIGPDFSKIHTAQFSNSKPISSMVHRNTSIAVKMTSAFENEMSGTGPSFSMGTTPAAAPHSMKKSVSKQPFSRSVSTSRARPTTASNTPATMTVSHRSSSVTATSSRSVTATPSTVSFAKTPVKSAQVSINKENLLSSANKNVNSSRRASHFSGKVSKGSDVKRDGRRNTFMDDASMKRQLSATKARNNVTKMETVIEPELEFGENSFVLESPGPFSRLISPQEF